MALRSEHQARALMRNLATRRFTAVAAVALALSLSGCAGGSVEVTPGTTDRWNVSVSDPVFHSDEMCGTDPDIESGGLSMDMPSSGYGLTLKVGATQDDARRIVDCLKRNLESGEISILSPK